MHGDILDTFKMNKTQIKLVLAVFLTTIASGLWASPAHAAAVTSAKDTMSTIYQSVVANHTVQFVTPTGVSAGQTITITFPTGFTIGSVDYTDIDMASGATCSGATDISLAATPATTTWGAVFSGQVLTLTSATGTVTATHCVVIEIGTNATYGVAGDQQITNQTAVQNNSDPKILIGGTMADSGRIAVEIVTNNTVAVTGQVDPQISCSIDDTTAGFGTFTLATVATADSTPIWTISTNATGGYNLAVRSTGNGSTAGLYSSIASYTIASATADLAGASSGYGLQGTKSDGDAGSAATTVSSPFTATGTNVGALVVTAFPGSGTTLASATGPVSNATVTSTLKAKVSGLVPSGSYVDTLTYVCTGVF